MRAFPDLDSRSAARASVPRLLVGVLFYVGCAGTLLVLIMGWQKSFLPSGIAVRLGHNSEVFALALILALVMDFARPAWLRQPRPPAWVWALGGALAVLGGLMLVIDLPAGVRTLNEPVLASGLLTGYVALRRPLGRMRWAGPALMAVLMVFGTPVPVIVTEAEALTALLAGTLLFDLIDRALLERDQRPSRWRWAWMLLLAVWPELMLTLNDHGVGGILGSLVDLQARGAEGYWGVMLLYGYLALARSTERH